MVKIYVLDTNILIQAPYAIDHFEDNSVVLPMVVLEELDHLKKAEGEIGANARRSIRRLEQLRQKGDMLSGVALEGGGTLRVEKNFVDVELPGELSAEVMDNRILKVCLGLSRKSEEQVILVTKDILLRIKAQILGICAEDFTTEQVLEHENQYSGRCELYVPEALFKDFKKKGIPADMVYAIDRQQIVDVVLNGFGRPAYSENDGMPWNNPEAKIETDPEYAAMIESVDENIGRLLRRLDELRLTDDTVVIFTSDNGGLATVEGSPTCNAPLSEGKGWMYEGGTREPLLIRFPRLIEPGSRCRVPVTSPDFYPTLLELAGLPLKPEQHRDGVSLLPLLKGGKRLSREAIFWHYPHYGNQGGTPGSSVRCGDWKLIEFFEDGHLELYNLRHDISEENNLAGAEPEISARLHTLLQNWRREVEALLPAVNDRPFHRKELK